MKFNASYIIAALAVIVIGIWFMLNSADSGTAAAPEASPAKSERALPAVTYRTVTAQLHKNRYSLYGRTEANREVSVKAETAGLVIRTPLAEGARAVKGQILCQQDVDARQARVDQARAQLASAEFDMRSTKTLVEKGYRSEIQLSNQQAQLDGARAAVKSAEIELDNVNMRAPFGGLYERQMAEVGDYLAPGQPCGLLLELNPLIVASDLSEGQLAHVKEGLPADIKLATGEQLTGKVRFIEARANSMTRTFRAEIAVPNPNMTLKAGITATVSLRAGEALAHNVPARVISLDNSGQVGVRYLTGDNIVRFAATKTIDEDSSGLWVTGLPETVRIITQGQDYVSVGTQVAPVLDSSASPPSGAAAPESSN